MIRRFPTLRNPNEEVDRALVRLKVTESLSDGDRIGVETLSDLKSIIYFPSNHLKPAERF